MLGVEAVDIRSGWSAQNNAVLLTRFLSLVQHLQLAGDGGVTPTSLNATNRTGEPTHKGILTPMGELQLPWTGLTLVFSTDDCSEAPVDYVEGHVTLDPLDVVDQWAYTVCAVRQSKLQLMGENRAELRRLRAKAESLLTLAVQQQLAAAADTTSGDAVNDILGSEKHESEAGRDTQSRE